MEKLPIRKMPNLFCFGGVRTFIEFEKIKDIEALYYEDFSTGEYTPILYITMNDNSIIVIDYETIEEAEQSIKELKKLKFKRIK